MIYVKVSSSGKDSFNLNFYGDDKQLDDLNIPENGMQDVTHEKTYDYLAENGFIPTTETFFYKI